MRSRWSDEEAAAVVARYGARWGEELALRTYTSRLLGAEDRLVLHGGGNTSMKGTFTNRLGEGIPAMYVKAPGHDPATLEPAGHPRLGLCYLFQLARAVADAYEANPGRRAMVWMRHGLMTWGPTARAAYETMIEVVTRAETYLARKGGARVPAPGPTSVGTALARVRQVAPLLRGSLAQPSGDADRPHRRAIMLPLVTPEVLAFVDCELGPDRPLTPPLTSDHLIRT